VIERPIIISGAEAVIGRLPEAVAVLFYTGLKRLNGKKKYF
tara:strand:- start:170 stop:292 length:123 start_codon:yes stop_codon:yes gene_type:complete